MPGDASQLYNQTLQQYGNAAGAFEKQTTGIEQGYSDLYAQQAQFGASQQLALQQARDRNLASQQQSMLARGLGNTTALDAGARGVNYDYNNSLLTLNDQLLQRQNSIRQAQLGYQAQAQQGLLGLSQQTAGFVGNYAGQMLTGQQQQAQIGAQGAFASQQQAAQQQAQMQQMGQAQQNLQQNQQAQFNQGLQTQAQAAAYQSAFSAQQAQQQYGLQQAQYADQSALSAQNASQQDYIANDTGYY